MPNAATPPPALTTATGSRADVDQASRPARTWTATRRWWRRRPVNRSLVLVHRWAGLVLGLFLVVECTTGAILLYHGEIFRATNSALYHHTAGANPVTPERAVQIVKTAHPDFDAAWAAYDQGVLAVGDAAYKTLWFVDPGTGRINGSGNTDTGFMGLLVQVHDCAFSCEGFPAYGSWFATDIWDGGPSFLHGITRGEFILGVLGLLLVVLVLTSMKIWWPGLRRLGSRFVVRRGKGRFARDFDLHNLVGAVALPFLLMWGVTGAAFYFPAVENAWLAITGGHTPPKASYDVTPNPATANAPLVPYDTAVSIALDKVPGTVNFVGLPTPGTPYYEFDIVTGYGSYEHRAIYNGDAYVYIDAHDASNVNVFDDGTGPAANRFYAKYFEAAHFGWQVNGWWRIIWAVFGLAPLALFATGVSTWLFRRGVRKRRARAGCGEGAYGPAL